MAKQTINNGNYDKDPSAEKVRTAFDKVNDNFTELYNMETKVERFLATEGKTTHVLSVSNIADNGTCQVVVNGQEMNSRTGVASFTNGDISIDFSTPTVTFHFPLKENDQVVIRFQTIQ